MELVYLWVEDYKNIHKQGFNFSPRFECTFHDEYDEDGKLKENCQLEIIEKKEDEYIKDFFGENINVTAIVGKNGSGKSTIFEVLTFLFLKEIETIGNVLLLIEQNNQYNVFSSFNFRMNNDLNLHKKALGEIQEDDIHSIYHSPNFTNGSLNNTLELFSTPRNSLHISETFKFPFKTTNVRIQTFINLVFNANRLITIHPSDGKYKKANSFSIQEMLFNYNISKTFLILHFLKTFGKRLLPFEISNNEKINISIIHNEYTYKIFDGKPTKRFFIDIIKEFIESENLEKDEEGYTSHGSNREELNIKRLKKYIPAKEKFINFLSEIIGDEKPTYHDTLELSIGNSLKLLELYLELYDINENFPTPFLEWNFKDFSSGEENFMLIFSLLTSAISTLTYNKTKNKSLNFIIMLDEIENNLHPKWQKEIFTYMIKFFELIQEMYSREYNCQIKLHILSASHSPFILSDIPKQNIIFLDKDEKGNCKVVDGLSQTFGANIHTLLSDSFFMEDGLMGEFAKGKINKIKRFYDIFTKYQDNKKIKKAYKWIYLKKRKNFWHIQSIIGEPFLKTVIKNYLDEVENILFDDTKAKEMAIERLIQEFDKDDIMRVLNGKT